MNEHLEPVVIPCGPSVRRSYRCPLISIPGSTVLAYFQGRSVCFYDFERSLSYKRVACKGQLTALAVHPKGYYLAAGDACGVVEVFSLDNPELITKFTLEYTFEVSALDFDFEGGQILIAAKALHVFNMQTELKQRFPSPDSYITYARFSAKRPYSACCTAFSGEVFFYENAALKFAKSHETRFQKQDCAHIGGKWCVAGASGLISVYSAEFELLYQLKIAEQTVYALAAFYLGGASYLACACGDAQLVTVRVHPDKDFEVVGRCAYAEAVYANNVVAVAWSQQHKAVICLTLAGRFAVVPAAELLSEQRSMDAYERFVVQSNCTHCVAMEQHFYRFGVKGAVIQDLSGSKTAVLNMAHYDYILPNAVLFSQRSGEGVRGLTTTEAFQIQGTSLAARPLETAIFAASGDAAKIYLFARRAVFSYDFETNKYSVLFYLPAQYREILAADWRDGQFALALAYKQSAYPAHIFLTNAEFSLARTCSVFAEPNFLHVGANLLFAGSADVYFVVFALSDFAKADVWPTYTKLDRGSKQQGRIAGVLETAGEQGCAVVFGERGVCKWRFDGQEATLEGCFSGNGAVVSVVGDFACCADGAIRRIALQK